MGNGALGYLSFWLSPALFCSGLDRRVDQILPDVGWGKNCNGLL